MASIIKVSIHSDLSEFPTEKRYDEKITIAELKEKLELITGANHETMKISIALNDNETKELDDNSKTFGHYAGEFVGKDSVLKVTVKDDQAAELLSGDVPKYTIPEEKYKELPNNARNFIKEAREIFNN